MTPRLPRSHAGSTLRLIVGAASTLAAVLTALVGFLRLITVLERGGYGTTDMRVALVILGVSGALLSLGIATLIWEISKRYESPGEPEVGDRDTTR